MNAPPSTPQKQGQSVPHLAANLALSVGQYSCAGRKNHNEDAIGIRLPEGNLLTTKGAAAVIADGVSAAEAGQEASQTCVTSFLSDYFSTPESWSVKQSAAQVLNALNRWLYSRGRGFHDNTRGYITTMSAVVFKSRNAHLLHVGDSRIYRLRSGRLEQLSTDHSTPVADGHAYLARAMGLDVRLDVDYKSVTLEVGDLYLLTTDGVHDTLSPTRLVSLASRGDLTLEERCRALANAALDAGSTDNLSCQLLQVDHLPDENIDEVISRLTDLSFPPFLEPGMVLDGLKVLRELHASTRSQVYQVEEVETGQQYCMKTPSVNFEDDPAYIERFVMESWIGTRINSPYVVKVVERQRPKSCLYYLTEFVQGITLTQWMKEHPKPAVEEVVYLVDQIAKGIRAFHRRETLHQDIKPGNIMIDGQGQVKIIDFGACRVAGIAEIATPLSRDQALGTASYSAPEYRVGTAPDPRADLFSLAVITFEMFTDKLPFQGKLERCNSARDFLSTTYTPSYQLNPLVPHWIDGALRKALRFHPERRHGDVSEFVHELQQPNPKYLEYRQRPLMERNPVATWKAIAAGLFLLELLTLALLLKK